MRNHLPFSFCMLTAHVGRVRVFGKGEVMENNVENIVETENLKDFRKNSQEPNEEHTAYPLNLLSFDIENRDKLTPGEMKFCLTWLKCHQEGATVQDVAKVSGITNSSSKASNLRSEKGIDLPCFKRGRKRTNNYKKVKKNGIVKKQKVKKELERLIGFFGEEKGLKKIINKMYQVCSQELCSGKASKDVIGLVFEASQIAWWKNNGFNVRKNNFGFDIEILNKNNDIILLEELKANYIDSTMLSAFLWKCLENNEILEKIKQISIFTISSSERTFYEKIQKCSKIIQNNKNLKKIKYFCLSKEKRIGKDYYNLSLKEGNVPYFLDEDKILEREKMMENLKDELI